MKSISLDKQLNNFLDDVCEKNDGLFGHNVDLDIKEIRRYIKKLKKLGCKNFYIPDYYTIEFELPGPCDQSEALLFILKNALPSDIKHNKSKYSEKLTLYWYF